MCASFRPVPIVVPAPAPSKHYECWMCTLHSEARVILEALILRLFNKYQVFFSIFLDYNHNPNSCTTFSLFKKAAVAKCLVVKFSGITPDV